MSPTKRRLLCLVGVIAILAFIHLEAGASSEEQPLWWPRVSKLAESGGYQLITPQELNQRINDNDSFLLVDVRPKYEYEAGHLPGAVNLEFHLGDRAELGAEKKTKFLELLGSNKYRSVVIYCRSFR